MTLSPGRILPRDMNERQFGEWSRKQMAATVEDTFIVTPEWSGFSVEPTGRLVSVDLGALIVLYPESGTFTGTSNTNGMIMFHGIDGINPPVHATIIVRDDAGDTIGEAYVTSIAPGSIQFAIPVLQVPGTDAVPVLNPAGFTASGTKGWRGQIMFPKVPLRRGGGSNY